MFYRSLSGLGTHNVVYIVYVCMYPAVKKDEIMNFAKKLMEPEKIILSEVSRPRKTNIKCSLSSETSSSTNVCRCKFISCNNCKNQKSKRKKKRGPLLVIRQYRGNTKGTRDLTGQNERGCLIREGNGDK